MNIIGRKPVLEALRSGQPISRIKLAIGVQGRIIGDILSEAKKQRIRIDRIPAERVNRDMGGGNHQGVIAEASPVEMFLPSDIGGKNIPIRYRLLVALDGVTDPHHLGAIARSAAGAGCDALLVPAHRSATMNETAIKSSAGLLLKLPFVQAGNLGNTLTKLRADNWWVVGADMRGDSNLWEYSWNRPTILVMGSEGKGLSSRIANLCDELISIPLESGVESLSVSAAASVILFDISRKRK